MYIYISSTESPDYFTGNTAASFRVKLPKTLHKPHDTQWFMAILDINIPDFTDNYSTDYITVSTPVCEESIDNAALRPVLNRIYNTQLDTEHFLTFDTPRYIRLTVEALDTVDIHLTDSLGGKPSFAQGKVTCTLHLIAE